MAGGCVIVGTGQGGFEAAEALRTNGYQDPITLIGDEPHIPYQRPPLSKGFILDKQGMDEIELRPGAFYRDHHLELLAGERVLAIDRAGRRVRRASGEALPYDWLVLAVGARNRRLPVDGVDLDGVLYLRTLDESVALKERLQQARDVLVIGGGFIGLEVAASARALGSSVTVLEAQPRLMPRVVAPAISEYFDRLHTDRGVTVVCGATVTKLAGGADGRVRTVHLADGTTYPADAVVVGIGVVPNVELAQEAGLAVGNGIAVDEFLQTTDPAIFAIGDCAEYPNPFAGARVRLESVQNAVDQARSVAAAIVGRRAPYRALPWFWTDQFDVRLQMAGLSQGYDRAVTRGAPEAHKFSVFYFAGGRLIAVDSVNRPAEHIFARKMLAAGVPFTPEQAADEAADLKAIVRSAAL
jgi:3-phenylpropionate/trans-cinnamate dioxygenase ferredoxin reductase subunit